MARVKLSEFRAKTILANYLGTDYSGFYFDADNDSVAKLDENVKAEKSYVVKVDQAIKKRFKQGLIKLELKGVNEILDALKEYRQKGYRFSLVEEFIAHNKEDEKYLAIERTALGNVISYSSRGGIDVEDFKSEIKQILITDSADLKKAAEELGVPTSFIEKLAEAFDINYFSFLEINPLVVSFKTPYLLDVAGEVDSAAEFFAYEWNTADFRDALGNRTPEEENIAKLSEKSQASFKLVVLNPQGSIFMLLSGGGASIVLADEVYNLGKGQELANYGEYSGNPNEEETYIYTKNILSLLLASQAKDKILIIGGGVANFTDIRITFRGVIRAIDEVKDDLAAQNVSIYVRRGGPHEEEGLLQMHEFLVKAGIKGEVYGPELVLTDIVTTALKA